MKYISYIALLGAASLQSAAAQDSAKGPACTAHKINSFLEGYTFGTKITAGEVTVPARDADDEEINDWFKEHVYDTTLDECDEGLSCSIYIDYTGTGTGAGVQSCQKCY